MAVLEYGLWLSSNMAAGKYVAVLECAEIGLPPKESCEALPRRLLMRTWRRQNAGDEGKSLKSTDRDDSIQVCIKFTDHRFTVPSPLRGPVHDLVYDPANSLFAGLA